VVVGVFDSGIGGLSVVKSLKRSKYFKKIIYYGDTARVPYGSKDKNTIISYSLEALEFFKNFDLELLIIACNSVSAYALEELNKNAPFPVVGVIEAGIEACNDLDKDKNILVIGTKATIESNLYKIGLEKKGFKNIIQLATPLFVPLVEEKIFDGPILKEVMKYYFNGIKTDYIVLGCTHYPLIKDKISNFFGGIKTIHSGEAIVKLLEKEYKLEKKFKSIKIEFFASSNPEQLKSIAKEWL